MKFDDLFEFFSAYFHEDWDLQADSADGIVSLFLGASPSLEERRELADQIEDFADLYKDDDELERALFKVLGCYYLPSADKINPRTWILTVRERLLAMPH